MTDLTPDSGSPAARVLATDVDDRYLDAGLPTSERVEILLGQMTLEEKAGLFFHAMIGMNPDGTIADPDPTLGIPGAEDYIHTRHMTHFNLLSVAKDPAAIAQWHNRIQEMAAATRLGIPVTISSDPRHSSSDNHLAALTAGAFSLWPETLGLAALRDERIVEEFADIARQEYTSVGIRVALHPQVDLATEPRWCRQLQTFGEDPDLAGRLGAAYVRGFQGAAIGAGSVSTMTKHFPGGGPQMDGEDAHFPYGREQVYPGGQFATHLKPFEAAFRAGTRQIMPYYGMPIGTEYEEVGFGFNKSVITGLLREHYGFDGIVCTDWGLITDATAFGEPFPARAWGVEHLDSRERMLKILHAGVDQFGGESIPELLIDLVVTGEIDEERLDTSARRLLREKFELGLFENRYVDIDHAVATVGRADFVAAGQAAQRASTTLLTNNIVDEHPALPLRRGLRLYTEGIEPELAAEYGRIVDTPDSADVAILRIQAPWEERDTVFANLFHSGSLDFPDHTIARVNDIARRVPTILDIFLDRPAILTPFIDTAAAIIAHWGSSPRAVLDVLTGADHPRGTLPFDLPSSMDAVAASREDIPFDTTDPLFRFGHGLRYNLDSGRID